MRRPIRSSGLIAAVLAGLSLGAPASAQADADRERSERQDVLRASESWRQRPGPGRAVVDQVCLVPDVATFLEAIATWDDRRFFPILIDDADFTLKFLREFRPARILRFPRKVVGGDPDRLWERAVAAVGRSWHADAAEAGRESPAGDESPRGLGSTPPGVVLASPRSESLAGAVALAAGRFQPLLRWDASKHYSDVLAAGEARDLALRIERTIARKIPRFDRLGDDCDFITLAGDWPYRYEDGPSGSYDQAGFRAFDDLLGRDLGTLSRWAYCGRLMGDARASVYRAMCSLFLQPSSALLFDTGQPSDKTWAPYGMDGAALDLKRLMTVVQRSGQRASLRGWHDIFGVLNRFGLVMINTHGQPNQFHLPGGPGRTADIPRSRPAAVLMIHSFSAADPANGQTLAGRWLAAGAYVYFGSVHEPYLQSFRTPGEVATLAARSIPLVVALRKTPSEWFGHPWRLIYLGDPLFRLEGGTDRPRIAPAAPFDAWPRYFASREPAASAPDDVRLKWALKTVLFQLQTEARAPLAHDVAGVLRDIERSRLSPELRPIHDALLVDLALNASPAVDPLDALLRIPPNERSPVIRDVVETLGIAGLEAGITSKSWNRASNAWEKVARSRSAPEVLETATQRLGRFAEATTNLRDWRTRLRAAERDLRGSPGAGVVDAEVRRVEQVLAPSRTR